MDNRRWGKSPQPWSGETGPRQSGSFPDVPSAEGGGGTDEGFIAEGNNRSEIKEWQRAYWTGPKPPMLNPFDEPENAPELREERSDNLYNRSGDFWQGKVEGYPGPQSVQPQEAHPGKRAELQKRKNGSSTFRTILITFAVLVMAAAALYFLVFRVRHITVTGNRSVSDEDIIRVSGIKTGEGILSLTQEDVAARINGDFRLQFVYLEKQLPDGVILCVREREPVSCFTFCGILYTMDKHRVVLNETEQDTSLANGLIRIDGMDIRGGCAVGQKLVLNSKAQEEAYESLIVELKVIDCLNQVLEINVTDPNSIMLTIRAGAVQDGTGSGEGTFTVVLGNSENLHAKLRAMLLVRQEIVGMGYRTGTITVSTPVKPVFSP